MDNYLEHHGIEGQRWGVRRFQRSDGSLTPAGKKRYAKEAANAAVNVSTGKVNVSYSNDRISERVKNAGSKRDRLRSAKAILSDADIETGKAVVDQYLEKSMKKRNRTIAARGSAETAVAAGSAVALGMLLGPVGAIPLAAVGTGIATKTAYDVSKNNKIKKQLINRYEVQ